MENNERFDKELEQAIEQKKMEAKAHMMMLDMLAEIVPAEHRPMFELPKMCRAAAEKVGEVMLVAKQYDNFDEGIEYAKRACAFLARVNEAVEAFIEHETPSKSKKPSEFDQM